MAGCSPVVRGGGGCSMETGVGGGEERPDEPPSGRTRDLPASTPVAPGRSPHTSAAFKGSAAPSPPNSGAASSFESLASLPTPQKRVKKARDFLNHSATRRSQRCALFTRVHHLAKSQGLHFRSGKGSSSGEDKWADADSTRSQKVD